MQVHVVDKSVEIFLILNTVGSVPAAVVDIRLLRAVLVREIALISSLNLHAVGYLILVVELQFPAVVVHEHRAILVIIFRRTLLGDILS